MSMSWENKPKDSVIKVLDNTIRLANGRVVLSQAHPTIFHRSAKSISRTNFDNLTVGDVLQRLRKTKQMAHMVLNNH